MIDVGVNVKVNGQHVDDFAPLTSFGKHHVYRLITRLSLPMILIKLQLIRSTNMELCGVAE